MSKKIKRNLIRPFNSLKTRNLDYQSIEEVYKLNFTTQNLYDKNSKDKNEKNNKQSLPEFFRLNKSIERVKKFVPNLSELLNFTNAKKLEKKLIKRFENQEKEKIMVKDLNQVKEKRDKIKKSISDNLVFFQQLDNQISDIKLSMYVHSKMSGKSIMLTPNKRINKDNLKLDGLKKVQTENISKTKAIKLDFHRRIKLLNDRLTNKKEEISKMEMSLPEIELNRKKVLLKLKQLEQEKKDLKNIKDDISEKLYSHYLKNLKEGIDTRNQGLSYIIKEIFNLDKAALISYFPDYLDFESINYLLRQATLRLKLEDENKQMKKLKNYFSDNMLFKNKKKRKNKKEIENYFEKDEIKNNNNSIQNPNKEEKINFFSTKKSHQINRNKFNNSFFNSKGFSRFNSTEATSFSNFNNDKYLKNTEINFNNKNDTTNNFNETNKYNSTTSDINVNSEHKLIKKIKINNDTKRKNNFYKKLLLNHRIISNSPSPNKKIDLSDLYSIPDILTVKQVENYLKSNQNNINVLEKNNDKITDYFKLNKKIKNTKNNIEENQKKEMKRIFKKYLEREYSQNLISEKEQVLSALIGEDNVQPELRKQIRKTKLFFESIKKCGLTNNSSNKEYKVNQISHSYLRKQEI